MSYLCDVKNVKISNIDSLAEAGIKYTELRDNGKMLHLYVFDTPLLRIHFFKEMETNNTLNVWVGHISHAANDEDFCHALALCIGIKVMFTNSIIYGYSIQKLQNLFHSKYANIKKAVECGIRFNLFEITYYHGKAELRAKSLIKRNRRTARFKIGSTKNKRYIYVESKKQNNSKKANGKYNTPSLQELMYWILVARYAREAHNYCRFCNHEIFDVLRNTRVTRTQRKLLVTQKTMGERVKYLNRIYKGTRVMKKISLGVSNTTILKHCFNNSIGLSKLHQICKTCKDYGLITKTPNYIVMDPGCKTYFGIAQQNVSKPNSKNPRDWAKWMDLVNKECFRMEYAEGVMRNADGYAVCGVQKQVFIGKGGDSKKLVKRTGDNLEFTGNMFGKTNNRKR